MKWALPLIFIISCSSFKYDDFKNLRYRSPWAKENSILLKNGEGLQGNVNFTLLGPPYSGKYAGHTYFALVLVTSPPGSGVFRDLAILTPGEKGLKQVANLYLGDRVKIKNVQFKGKYLLVTMIAHGEKDPMCCPTEYLTHKYSLKNILAK